MDTTDGLARGTEVVDTGGPISVPVGDVTRDEHPRADTSAEKLAALKPAFRDGGTVTAGNSSGLNDGAAAVVIASEEKAQALGLAPLGAFVGSAVAGVDPRVMGIGPAQDLRNRQRGLIFAGHDGIELIAANGHGPLSRRVFFHP